MQFFIIAPISFYRPLEVIKAAIQFVSNLGHGFMNSSCNVQGTKRTVLRQIPKTLLAQFEPKSLAQFEPN